MLKFLCFVWLFIVFTVGVCAAAVHMGVKDFLITLGIVLGIMLTLFSLLVLSE